MAQTDATAWLLLIHQVPNSPSYLRVKMWRRLQKVGAVPVKNAVYVLPRSDETQEDFHWIAREILEAGGDASVCEATFIEGMNNNEIRKLFQTAREADYADLLSEIKTVNEKLRAASKEDGAWASGMVSRVARLRQRAAEIQAIDFFDAGGGKQAETLLSDMESQLRKAPVRKPQSEGDGSYSGVTWVTRKGIHVDRIGSAWLIRRFIDRDGRFKFVSGKGYRPEKGEQRFDMFDAEFTHEGDLCTFEVLLERLELSNRALHAIAEIIHDIDLKDGKFGREETPGIALVINAICRANKEDNDRLERGTLLFDDLYEFFKKR
jgi:hypothetical protein